MLPSSVRVSTIRVTHGSLTSDSSGRWAARHPRAALLVYAAEYAVTGGPDANSACGPLALGAFNGTYEPQNGLDESGSDGTRTRDLRRDRRRRGKHDPSREDPEGHD